MVKWVEFQDVIDDRGRLTAIEGAVHVPFPIYRIFYVHQVKAGLERGGHAHRDTDQVLVAVHGMLRVELSDGSKDEHYTLDDPGKGLFVPRMIWIRMRDFSQDAVCLVLASTKYDRSRSLRSWDDFLQALSST